MTAPTAPQGDDWLQELLDEYYWACEYDGTNGHMTPEEVTAAIRSRISEAEAAARIDELIYWRWLTDGHIEMSGKEVDRRISELKARQADTSGRE